MFSYDLSGKNKYYTLYENIRGDILRGAFKAGEKLPGKRTLAGELGVSVVTVQTAYDQLLAEGYITSKERSGYFVCPLDIEYRAPRAETDTAVQTGDAAEMPSYIADFVRGTAPAELFPFSSWARLMRSVLADCGEHLLERVPEGGDRELKSAISAYLYRARGIVVDPRYIVIGAGAEQLYGTIVQLIGRDRSYAVEDPGYRKISETYKLNGARCAHIPVNSDGIDVEAAVSSGADVLHISPAHQFPTGAVTPASVRVRLINAAERRGGYIVEDDYDSEFRLIGKPLQNMYAVSPERVVYVNTFSKTLAPSMRMGYMVLPPALYAHYVEVFGKNSCCVPLFEQKALARMISGGIFERHINRMKNYYRGVREELLKALSVLGCPHEVCDTASGLHFTVKFPNAPSDGYIKERAARAGINIRCLSDYLFKERADCKNTVVVNYSGINLKTAQSLSSVLGHI